jgi:hypothetical protein
MIFLGNPESFHLHTWRRIYELCGEPIEGLLTIGPVDDQSTNPGPLSRLSKLIAYTKLGLHLRSLADNAVLHAHGASGYGLVALLSGRRYVATIYGSEILSPHGLLYRMMMRAILRGAAAITVTSAEARDAVSRIDSDASAKTHLFHTGIETSRAASVEREATVRPSGKMRILLLRNAAPQYRTAQVLSGVMAAIVNRNDIDVVIPIGNGDSEYLARVQKHFPDRRFHFLNHRIDNDKYLRMIAESDICINFPVSDQVSTTLVESLYFDRVVVTNRLPAYADFLEVAEPTGDWIFAERDEDLACSIALAITRVECRGVSQRAGRQAAIQHFSIENAARCFGAMLDKMRSAASIHSS